ncbi:unnamed protein product, partial [Rotaria sp. Silwood2]
QPKVEAPILENDQSCVFGQDTQISWKFSGIPKPRVTWLFNDQSLPTNDRLQVMAIDDGTSILKICKAECNDHGVYTATATNAFGEAKAQTTLTIDSIKPFIKTNLNTTLNEQEKSAISLTNVSR